MFIKANKTKMYYSKLQLENEELIKLLDCYPPNQHLKMYPLAISLK